MLPFASLLNAMVASGDTAASCPPSVLVGGPQVIVAVAPRFPDIAVQARIGTTLEVCVDIGADGVPVKAELIPPFRIFEVATEEAALRWRFAPSEKSNSPRRVRLRFVLKLIQRDGAPAEETTVFRPPYEVEVRHVTPELVSLPVR